MSSQSFKSVARILIVDEYPTIRTGLAAWIARCADMQVCGEAGDLRQACKLLELQNPDIVVVDLAMPDGNGLELVKKIKAERRQARALVWSGFKMPQYAERALRAGAQGYITKSEPTERILEAIRLVHAGGTYSSEPVTKSAKRKKSANEPVTTSFVDELSERELQVFQMLGEGFDMARISQRMALSIKTIETYRARIKQKLNCPSRTELVRTAVEWVLRSDLASDGRSSLSD